MKSYITEILCCSLIYAFLTNLSRSSSYMICCALVGSSLKKLFTSLFCFASCTISSENPLYFVIQSRTLSFSRLKLSILLMKNSLRSLPWSKFRFFITFLSLTLFFQASNFSPRSTLPCLVILTLRTPLKESSSSAHF